MVIFTGAPGSLSLIYFLYNLFVAETTVLKQFAPDLDDGGIKEELTLTFLTDLQERQDAEMAALKKIMIEQVRF